MLSSVVFYYKYAYFVLTYPLYRVFLSKNWNIHRALNISGISTLPYPGQSIVLLSHETVRSSNK